MGSVTNSATLDPEAQIWNSGDVEVAILNAESLAIDEGRRAVQRKGMGGTRVRSHAVLSHKEMCVGDIVAFVTDSVSPTYKMYGDDRHNCQDVSRQILDWATLGFKRASNWP